MKRHWLDGPTARAMSRIRFNPRPSPKSNFDFKALHKLAVLGMSMPLLPIEIEENKI